jgi:large subunit ribosomal protein L19
MSIAAPTRSLATCLQFLTFTRTAPASRRHVATFAKKLGLTGRGKPVFHTPHSILSLPRRRIKIHASVAAPCTKDPIADLTTVQLRVLDPAGARQKLFSRDNKDAIRVGDIVQVRRTNGEPFAGVLINLRRRGVDTAILLRNQVTRIGVEMWFKLYSPRIEGVDLVQRAEKRKRRAKLYYMRWVSRRGDGRAKRLIEVIGSRNMISGVSRVSSTNTCGRGRCLEVRAERRTASRKVGRGEGSGSSVKGSYSAAAICYTAAEMIALLYWDRSSTGLCNFVSFVDILPSISSYRTGRSSGISFRRDSPSSWSLNFCIFPLAVLGKSSAQNTYLGT